MLFIRTAGRRARQLVLTTTVAMGFIALFAAAPARAQYYGQNKVQYRTYDWKSISADHFEVYYYAGLDSMAKRVLDLAEKTNITLSARMGHQLTRRVPIILYGSHNDFAQTNVISDIIDAGTGGFTEALRNRVVLPFTGSYEDLRHVVVHELVHAFMFDLLYGGSAASLISGQGFFQAPLWFGEGMAEYFSLGGEPWAEMIIRDGTIHDYLPPLQYSGGYFVYKQGQLAMMYLVERFGEERIRDILQRMRSMRNFEGAFQRSTGMTVERFDEMYREWLRKRYWPTVAQREDPERFARRLTDHRRDASNLNTAPAISPQGDRIAYFSDRRQYTDVYVMSAFDGRVLNRVIQGERDMLFESIPSQRGSITWSPDGKLLALTAKSGGRDALYMVVAKTGELKARVRLECEALAYPAWSPQGDSIVVAGVKDGATDLYLISIKDGRARRLTHDIYDEKEPCWSPDGRTITFASDRVAPVVLHPLRQEKGYGSYAIYSLNLDTGNVEQVMETHGDDHAPAWSPDGRKLAFISDRDDAPNIYLFDPADSTVTQLTDVQGGVTTLSWSREGDRLVFASFTRGGFDIFVVKEPLSLDPVLERLQRQAPQAVLTVEGAQSPAPTSVVPSTTHGALAGNWGARPDSVRNIVKRAIPDSVGPTLGARSGAQLDSIRQSLGRIGDDGSPDSSSWSDTLHTPEPVTEPQTAVSGAADTVRVPSPYGSEPPPWLGGGPPSTLGPMGMGPPPMPVPLPTTTPLEENGGPFALSDSILSQRPSRYRLRFAPDYAGGGFYGSTTNFVGALQFLFSDFLGNHTIYMATDLFSGSFEETNALVFYNYLPRRWDLGFGVFHFTNYFATRVTTLGENLGTQRTYSDRSFGFQTTLSLPFDRFQRLQFGWTEMFVERIFFEVNAIDQIIEQREYKSVTSPSLSLIRDNALFGYYGPVNGTRYNFTVSPALPWAENALVYTTLTADLRRYWDLTGGYTFANRFLGAFSGGQNPQFFEVGGYSTLRGFEDFSLIGSRVAIVNTELRFPFINQLGLVGPLPLGVFNLRGAAFADAGVVWSEGYEPRLTETVNGNRQLKDLLMGFGGGVRSSVFFLIMRVDVAWRTDFQQTSSPIWYFSIGPEF